MSAAIKNTLIIDIETSPMLVYTWGLKNQFIGLNQIVEHTQMLSWAAKWHGSKKVMFMSDHHDGHEAMVQGAYDLWNEANVVVHFNGKRFDTPHLRREFIEAGLQPPSPVHEIDLFQASLQFRWASHKLQNVSTRLGLDGKLSHTGFDLWKQCLAGDEKAWNLMRRYNKQDVVVTEELYDELRPWIRNHPHVGLFAQIEGDVCGNCGSEKLQARGYDHTKLGRYHRYQCQDCGKWSRGKRAIQTVDARTVNS